MENNKRHHSQNEQPVQAYSGTREEFDFAAANTQNLPDGYPATFSSDAYSREPFSTDYEVRRQAYLDYCAGNPARPVLKGFFYEMARLATNAGPINMGALEGAMEYVNERIDCADFVLLGLLRLILQFDENPAIPDDYKQRLKQVVLDFKYWPDEPGKDSLCTWTENHQALFAACEYLAGRIFPDEVFTNSGATGFEKKEKARARLNRWMELRFRTGFNEWLSNVYYDEDISAMVALADFCDDERLARGAMCILDLLFFDMSLNSFKGTFGSTHGRSYEREKKSGLEESTADTQKLMFGMGTFGSEDNMSGIHLALSEKYQIPKAICDIAWDTALPEMTNRHRAGINIGEAERWGLSFDDLDDGMTLLSFEAYNHPKVFPLFMRLMDAYNWWDNDFLSPYRQLRRPASLLNKLGLMKPLVWLLRKDISRNMREEVHTLTYRTPDYMLSAALDYKKGHGGDQQHIWQATLSEEAIVFTTHPGSFVHRSPDYWTGSGFLPRVAMHNNVLVAVYRISSMMPGLYMKNRYNLTHAYFPRERFDEVGEKNGWVFGMKGNAYIALRSRNDYRWQKEGADRDAEIIADGKDNIWLCEMGRKDTHGNFEEFQKSIAAAEIAFDGLSVRYKSPSCGMVRFGWRGDFRVDGEKVPLRHELRYHNPYAETKFDPETIEIRKGDEWLRLERQDFTRSFSPTV